jgi:hypothetical protein
MLLDQCLVSKARRTGSDGMVRVDPMPYGTTSWLDDAGFESDQTGDWASPVRRLRPAREALGQGGAFPGQSEFAGRPGKAITAE